MNYLKYFFYGILAAAGSLVLEFIFIILFFSGGNDYEKIMSLSIPIILASAFIEELLKCVFIRKMYYDAAEKIKIIFYSLILGAGFSFFEFILNLVKNESLDELKNSYLWGAFLLHLLTAGSIGFMFLKFKVKERNVIFFGIILLTAFTIHVLYNFTVLYLLK